MAQDSLADHAPTALDLFDSVLDAFQTAQAARAPITRDYFIAGFGVRLCFAGTALVSGLTAAFASRVATAPAAPDLTICIWDAASTNTPLPTLPWQDRWATRRGDVRGLNDDRICAALDGGAGILLLLDLQRNLALCCMRDAAELPVHETAAPLRTILYWWLRAHERYLVHGGALGTEAGGVLLGGKGGSGKSTTALVCLAAGMRYVSDDYCIVGIQPAPIAFNVYNTAKVTPFSLRLLQGLMRTPGEPQIGEKRVLFLDEHYAANLVYALPLKAIVLPHVTGGVESRLVPTSPNAALGALALSTIVQLPGAGNETLSALKGLTERLPCYALELGANIAALPRVIHTLLETL